MIPLRDGVRLASDVWRPEAPGKYPVLLTRTPYQRTAHQLVGLTLLLAGCDGARQGPLRALPHDRPVGARADVPGGDDQGRVERILPESVVDNKAIHSAFFDWCLKRSAPNFAVPQAQVYETGANRWRTFDQYPPAASAPTEFYLTSAGRANTRNGDGRLTSGPRADSPPDRFTYDPRKPVPTSMADQAIDRQKLQDREDVLVDTTDVGPDGRAIQLGPRIAIRRGRYRNGYAREELLTPGKVESFPIELFDIAHQFKPGHRIRLEVSSSAAPYYNPNQNTGNPVATDTVWKVAHQVIHHDKARPSSITLPVMPRASMP